MENKKQLLARLAIIISRFPVGYQEISVRIIFDPTLVPPVKIPIFMFLLPRLIARASQQDGNMTSFILHFSRLTQYCNALLCRRGTPRKIEIYFISLTPSVIFSRVAQPRMKILPMVSTR